MMIIGNEYDVIIINGNSSDDNDDYGDDEW